MSAKSTSTKLSAGEMEIMNVLWKKGPLTIAEAHAAFDRPIGYTTIQTRLNRLAKKGTVKKSEDRPAKYEAAISPDSVSAGHLEQLVENVAQGSVVPLVAQLLSNRKFSNDEIAELKKFIDDAESENK
ncbi:MAG: BlaI/MecI/CopY family transcriptional regulator [Verrucomicrobiales bacterium]|nr:BlaI/MecI/CopY family transcriptional regulator [Verrucomicrobiales bacterium]